MAELKLDKLRPAVSNKIHPFLDELLNKFPDTIHSIHITGTAVTDDYYEKVSDINTIIVLNKMDLKFLELLAPLGKKYRKHKVAAPLIMTPEYIKTSLDVFPIEFMNFKLIHSTVYGDDILENLEINGMDLRHQCERELKTKLILLRQGYLSALGDRKMLTEEFVRSITGYIPLFRGIVVLLGKEAPLRQSNVITALSGAAGISTDVFSAVLKEKYDRKKLSIEELNTIFKDYYTATEKLGNIVDEIKE